MKHRTKGSTLTFFPGGQPGHLNLIFSIFRWPNGISGGQNFAPKKTWILNINLRLLQALNEDTILSRPSLTIQQLIFNDHHISWHHFVGSHLHWRPWKSPILGAGNFSILGAFFCLISQFFFRASRQVRGASRQNQKNINGHQGKTASPKNRKGFQPEWFAQGRWSVNKYKALVRWRGKPLCAKNACHFSLNALVFGCFWLSYVSEEMLDSFLKNGRYNTSIRSVSHFYSVYLEWESSSL